MRSAGSVSGLAVTAMTNDNQRLKLLVLAGSRPTDEQLLNLLRSAFDVHLAVEINEAMDCLRHQPFDAVLAAAADFLPLERGLASQQAAVLLNTIGEGVCVVARDGRLQWTNAKLKAFDKAVIVQVVQQCRRMAEQFASAPSPAADNRHFSLTHAARHYDVVCSPIHSSQAELTHVAAVVFDATFAHAHKQKMDTLDLAGRELVHMGSASTAGMTPIERMRFIEDRTILYTRDLLHYDHFTLHVLNEHTGRLELLASMGMPDSASKAEIRSVTQGNGIPGYVAATGQSYLCPDVLADMRHRPLGLPDAKSSLTVPLKLQDKVIGVLSLESHLLGHFSDPDRQYVEILANYIATALNILNLLTVERHSTTTEITGVVTSELAGPLNDILVEAVSLMEEYIGHDDMRKRLERIAGAVDGIRRTIRQIAEAPSRGIMPSTPTITKDPILIGKRVLVADDEELIRNTIRDVLQRYGATVDVASNGAEAETLINAGEYQLVLSDIKMPLRTGYEVFSTAKARNPQTAVILITGFGYDPSHSIVRANPKGLAAVLFKPFKVNQLLEEVRAALK